MSKANPSNARARPRARASKEGAALAPRTRNPVPPPVPETLCTPELTQQVALLVAAGAPLPHACPAAGVKWDTAKEWLKPEQACREPYASFVAAMEKARASHAVGCVMRVTKAGRNGAWKADLAILERRHPEFYGRRLTREDVQPGQRLPAHAEGMLPPTDEELERIIRGGY